jgi:hypothetical protein
MKTLRMAVAIAMLLLAAPASAEIIDVRDYWQMVCYPQDAAPYKVEVTPGTLTITSVRGVRHHYRATAHGRLPPGFTVMATDFRIGRTLTAGFSASHGFLITDTGRDECSGDDLEAGPAIDPHNIGCSRMASTLGPHGRQRAEFRDSCKE